MWLGQTEGAKFWLSVLTELQNRGLKDIFIVCVDGLPGLSEAIGPVNMTLRKVTCDHHIFPSDEAVYKVVYLAMCNMAKKWTMPIHN
jgi:transposase-like protein